MILVSSICTRSSPLSICRARSQARAPIATGTVRRSLGIGLAALATTLSQGSRAPCVRFAGRRGGLLLLISLLNIPQSAGFQPASKAELKTATDAWVSDSSAATATYGDISDWDTSLITDMSYLFCAGSESYLSSNCDVAYANFNGAIGNWDVRFVTTMTFMFYYASSFNQDISSWQTSALTNMAFTFAYASSFDQNIGSWTTGSVTTMSYTFSYATAFNGDIGAWQTDALTDMSGIFKFASAFDQDIGAWQTDAVTNMRESFRSATSFDQDLNSWNTGVVTMMYVDSRAPASL